METELSKILLVRAGKLLARRSYSRGELGQKLAGLADTADVEAVLDRLAELRLLNDADYAYNFVSYRLTREGWGPLRIRRELLERRVAPNLVDAALERVLDEAGEEAALKVYLARHAGKRGWPTDRKRIQRLVLHLERRGFTPEKVRRTLRQEIGADAWQRFETGE